VQVFLETHSDHVLNGIRVAVADGSAALLPEQAAIHFFRAEDDGSPAMESMKLQRTGQLSAWPAGFLDQAQIDLAALAARRRRNS
jgi:predicted ATPase